MKIKPEIARKSLNSGNIVQTSARKLEMNVSIFTNFVLKESQLVLLLPFELGINNVLQKFLF